MSKEEYEAIVSQDKQNIIDYMNKVKTDAGMIKTACSEAGGYYQWIKKLYLI